MDDTDKQLLDAIGTGDQQALKVFFDRHQGAVFQFALRTVQVPEDAEEVLNEVMLEIWHRSERFQARSSVRTWMLSITHNKAVDTVRKKSRHEYPCDENHHEDQGDQCQLWEAGDAERQQQWIRRCMETLSVYHRQVVHLAFFEGLSYPAIAEITETAHGTVKTRMMHAKKKLLNCITRLAGIDSIEC